MTRLSLKRGKKGKKEQPITFSSVADNLVSNSKLISMTKNTLSKNIFETFENFVLYPAKIVGVKLSSVVDYIACICLTSLASYYYFN